jgi:hypothetical protein
MQLEVIDHSVFNPICTDFTEVDNQGGKMTKMPWYFDVPAPGPTNGHWDRRVMGITPKNVAK